MAKKAKTKQDTFFCRGCALRWDCTRCFRNCNRLPFFRRQECFRICRCNNSCFNRCRFSSNLVGCLRNCCFNCSRIFTPPEPPPIQPILPQAKKKKK